MIIFCWLFTFTLLFSVLAYHQASRQYWVFLPAGLLLIISLVKQPDLNILIILWLLWGIFALFIGVLSIRQRLLSAPILSLYRRILPTMSDTEKDALEAGSVWWDGDLFSGQPDWRKLEAIPVSSLSGDEQHFIKGPTQTLCDQLDDWDITHNQLDLPDAIWAFIKTHGFFGMIIPKQYGGLEFSALAHSNVVMKIASRSVTAAVSVMVPNSLGPAKLLLDYGTEDQKDYYLPRLAKGQDIPCFALTGPDAGSDAGAMPDFGVVCYGEHNGREVLGIRLNWEKRYITLGPIATLLGLAFKLYDPEFILGYQNDLGITLALIPTNTPGITIGQRHNPLNIPFQNGPNSGKDVFIPMEWIIGGQARIGQGWRMLMECLSDGRGISLPALSAGASQLACRYTGAYARVRKQFKTPIGQFEGIGEALASMAGKTYQIDSARRMTLFALDDAQNPSVVSAIIKYHLTERMRETVNHAMDIQGGSAICLGPKNLLGRGYQCIPISITVEGANILTRNMIIFGQGAIRCHPYVLKEMHAAKNDNRKQGLIDFDEALWAHIKFYLSNMTRAVWFGISHGALLSAPGYGPTRRYYQKLSWMSAVFALLADSAMITLGGALKRKERLSARLGDILSELYIASSVLKRYHSEGRPEADLPLVQWAMEDSLLNMQTAILGFLNNLPARTLARGLKWLIFPFGAPFRGPSDALGQTVAHLLLTPSETRDRLTHGVYQSDDPKQRVCQLEAALIASIQAHAVEKKIQSALKQGALSDKMHHDVIKQAVEKGVINEEEAELARTSKQLRREVIAVDAFDADAFAHGTPSTGA